VLFTIPGAVPGLARWVAARRSVTMEFAQRFIGHSPHFRCSWRSRCSARVSVQKLVRAAPAAVFHLGLSSPLPFAPPGEHRRPAPDSRRCRRYEARRPGSARCHRSLSRRSSAGSNGRCGLLRRWKRAACQPGDPADTPHAAGGPAAAPLSSRYVALVLCHRVAAARGLLFAPRWAASCYGKAREPPRTAHAAARRTIPFVDRLLTAGSLSVAFHRFLHARWTPSRSTTTRSPTSGAGIYAHRRRSRSPCAWPPSCCCSCGERARAARQPGEEVKPAWR